MLIPPATIHQVYRARDRGWLPSSSLAILLVENFSNSVQWLLILIGGSVSSLKEVTVYFSEVQEPPRFLFLSLELCLPFYI